MSVSAADPSDVATLRARLDALTARRAALRVRIASLEAARDTAHAAGTSAGQDTRPLPRPTSPQVMLLKGPFEVRDRMGKVIVHIGARGKWGRGLFVFNERERVGSQAALSQSGGGAIVAFDGRGAATGGSVHVGIFYTNDGPLFEATRPDGSSLTDIDYLGFQVYPATRRVMPAAILDSEEQSNSGGLQLTDQKGAAMVMAGPWPGHPGYGLVTVGEIGERPPLPPIAGTFARTPSFIRGRQP